MIGRYVLLVDGSATRARGHFCLGVLLATFTGREEGGRILMSLGQVLRGGGLRMIRSIMLVLMRWIAPLHGHDRCVCDSTAGSSLLTVVRVGFSLRSVRSVGMCLLSSVRCWCCILGIPLTTMWTVLRSVRIELVMVMVCVVMHCVLHANPFRDMSVLRVLTRTEL